MPYGFNRLGGDDIYPGIGDPAVIQSPVCVRANIIVENFPCYYQFQQGTIDLFPGSGQWDSEIYLPANLWVSLDRIVTGFRFRNAIAGSETVVTAWLFTPNEVAPQDVARPVTRGRAGAVPQGVTGRGGWAR